MGRNRVKGEGSIYQRANGRLGAQIYIAGERLGYSAKTRKEALDWLLKIRNEVKNGLNVEGSKISYSDFLDDWLETKKHHVAEQTWSYYSQIVRDYIKPILGKYMLRELSTRRIQSFYNHLVEQGVGLRTIEKNHYHYSCIFEFCCEVWADCFRIRIHLLILPNPKRRK